MASLTCAQVRSASIRSRASCARGSACCASDTPRCSSRVRCSRPAVSVASRRISPALIAAEQIRNTGSTAASARSSPAPSAPSIALAGTVTPAAVIGAEALPRSPSPSNVPATASPSAPAGTSHSVIGPAASALTGRLDHT